MLPCNFLKVLNGAREKLYSDTDVADDVGYIPILLNPSLVDGYTCSYVVYWAAFLSFDGQI